MKTFSFLITRAVTALFLISMAGTIASAGTTLKAVSFLPANHPLLVMANKWVKDVNQAYGNEIKIDFVGGPEVIKGKEQPAAVQNGVVDITFNVTAYFGSIFPEGWAFLMSKHSPSDERKKGGFKDYMGKRFERIGMKYLGRWLSTPFYLWTKKDVTSLKALENRKMRTAAAYDKFMKKMKIVPVTVMHPDVYSSLERGTVEGFGWPLFGPRDFGWTDSVKYVIDHPFNSSNNAVILVNLGSWNRLPLHIQKGIEEITAKMEIDMVRYFEQEAVKEWKKLEAAGIKRVRFSADDARKYLKIIEEANWEIVNAKTPDLASDLRRITGY